MAVEGVRVSCSALRRRNAGVRMKGRGSVRYRRASWGCPGVRSGIVSLLPRARRGSLCRFFLDRVSALSALGWVRRGRRRSKSRSAGRWGWRWRQRRRESGRRRKKGFCWTWRSYWLGARTRTGAGLEGASRGVARRDKEGQKRIRIFLPSTKFSMQSSRFLSSAIVPALAKSELGHPALERGLTV